MLVLPKEEGEGEQRQVVVCSLEAGKAGKDDHAQEELLDVLQHFNSNEYKSHSFKTLESSFISKSTKVH